MSDLRTRIAAVVRQHPQSDEWGIPQEECRNCKPFYGMDYAQHLADAVIRELLPTREGRWGWLDGTVSTNPKTGNPIKLEIEPGEIIPLSVDDARDVALALLAAVAECGSSDD